MWKKSSYTLQYSIPLCFSCPLSRSVDWNAAGMSLVIMALYKGYILHLYDLKLLSSSPFFLQMAKLSSFLCYNDSKPTLTLFLHPTFYNTLTYEGNMVSENVNPVVKTY